MPDAAPLPEAPPYKPAGVSVQGAAGTAPRGAAATHVPMLDAKSGRTVEVPADKVADEWKSGRLHLIKGTQVPVRLADGQLGTVDAEHASDAINSGAQIIPPIALHKEQMRQQQTGIGGGAKALAYGAVRGLLPAVPGTPLGADKFLGDIADLASPGAGERLREDIAASKEVHPHLNTAGEIAGMVGGAALGSAGNAVTGVGNLAEHVAEKAIGKGATTALGRVAQKAAVAGVRGAAEGALLGSNDLTSEAALGDHEINAEKFVAAVGHGALVGGSAGLLFGGAGAAFGEAKSAYAARAVEAGEAPAVAGERTGLRGKLKTEANEQAVRSLDPKLKYSKEMEKIPGGHDAVGDWMLANGVVPAGGTAADVAARAHEAFDAASARLNEAVKRAGADTEGVSVRGLVEKLENRAAEFDSSLGKKPAAEAIRAAARNLEEIYGLAPREGMTGPLLADRRVPIDEIISQRRELEGTINWVADPKPIAQGKMAAGRTLEDAVVTHLDEAGERIGDKTLRAEYEDAKLNWRKARVVEDMAEHVAPRGVSNRAISPTDYVTAAAGVANGGVGAGLGLGAIHHVIRTRGNTTAAIVLDRLSGLSTVARLAQKTDQKIAAAVPGILKKEERPLLARLSNDTRAARAVAKDRAERRAEYERTSKELEAAKAAPEASTVRLAERLGPVSAHAPQTTAAIAATVARANAYLESQKPARVEQDALFGRTTPPSDGEIDSWLRKVKAVNDPASVLEDLKKGRVTKDQVDALKAVYPKLFVEIQQAVRTEALEHKDSLTYQQRAQLAVLFDVPADATFQPAAIAAAQSVYGGPGASPGAAKPGKGGRMKPIAPPKIHPHQMNFGTRMTTSTQRLGSGGR